MSAVIRPLGDVLMQMLLRAADGEPRAGPGFEFYGAAFDVSTQAECHWTMLREHMRLEAEGPHNWPVRRACRRALGSSPNALLCGGYMSGHWDIAMSG